MPYTSQSVAILQSLLLIIFLCWGCTTQPTKEITQGDQNVVNGSVLKEDGKIIKQDIFFDTSGAVCLRITYMSDGLRVTGYIIHPKETGRYPVIIYNRGGNRAFGALTRRNLVALSDAYGSDYVILASQYRGNDGGQGWEEFGGDDVNDVLNLVPLAKGLDFADTSRIYMIGFSRGGMMTFIALRKMDFAAAAVIGSFSDLQQWESERGAGIQRVLTELVPRQNRDEEYRKRSPVYWADEINTPVLILHGERDWRVHFSHAERMHEALTKAGKTSKLILYERGNHPLSRHASERDRAIREWFSRHR